jgi:hypothetical protein
MSNDTNATPPVRTWAEEEARSQALRWGILGSLLVLFLSAALLFWAGMPSWPRVAASVGSLWLGWLWFCVRPKVWERRLAVLLALMSAGVCWLLVPTTGGLSLLAGQMRYRQLTQLPTGAIDAWTKLGDSRQLLITEFPSWEAPLVAWEQQWARTSAKEELAACGKLRITDPRAALERLRTFARRIAQVTNDPVVLDEVTQARRRVLLVIVEAADEKIVAQVSQGEFDRLWKRVDTLEEELLAEAGELKAEKEFARQLKIMREAIVNKESETLLRTLAELIAGKDFANVATFANQALQNTLPRAKRVQLDPSLLANIRRLRLRALEGRFAQLEDQLQKALDADEDARVAKLAQEALPTMRDEAKTLGDWTDWEAVVRDQRRTALKRRAVLIRASLLDLVRQKKEIKEATQKALDSLRDEAEAVGLGKQLAEYLKIEK